MKFFLFSFCVCANLFISQSQAFTLDIENDVENVISDKFISFAINPDVLLQENCSTTRNEWICMAKSLSPSYIRFEEIPELNLIADNKKSKLENEINESVTPFKQTVEIKMLNNFINWTKNASTVPIIKLNNSVRLENGRWNSISALKMLSMAHQLDIKECVWQLDIDCEKQNLHTYIDDLKSLKLMVDSFLFGRDIDWKIITGDLSNCINENYLENWSEFVKKSEAIVDAIDYDYVSELSSQNVNLSNLRNMKFNMLDHNIQLWKKYHSLSNNEEENYFDWLKTLGNSAIDGFTVVIKKLTEEDIIQPSLSYYISLLHKKFVGPEVLKLKFDDENLGNLSTFAHCAILPSGRVQDGITLFTINENDEEINITTKFSIKEDGGSIMQFILQKHDRDIFLNGEKMASEGDLRPMIIELPSEKPIHINIPPKAIGFWIVTNTNVKACSNQLGKTILFRNMIHKQLHPDHMTEVMKNLLLNQDIKPSFKSKRSADIKEENSDEETTTEFDLQFSESDDGFLEELSKFTARSPRFERYEEFFDTMGRLKMMMDLEKQLIEIGNSFLQTNDTSKDTAELEQKTVPNNSDKVHGRIVRSADDQNENIQTTTIKFNEEVITENTSTEDESNKNDKSMSEKIVMPKIKKINLENSVESLDKLIEKAKKVLKTLNEKTENETTEGNLESLDEKAPLVALPGIDPELQLKTELLKNKIKLNELKNKIKARILKLKTKLKLATPHKILKRNAKDDSINTNELFVDEKHNKFEKTEDFEKANTKGFLGFKENYSNTNNHFDVEKNNSGEKIDESNFVSGKPIDNRNPIFRETTLNDILEINVTEKYSENIQHINSAENDGVGNFLKSLSEFYDNLKTKLDKLWKITIG